MALTEQVLAKLAAASLSNESVRKGIGWVLVAAMSPLILIVSVLCAMAGGSAEHNNTAVKACFYGAAYTEAVPAEYKTHIAEMQTAFSLLDSAVTAANSQADAGGSLDPLLVKAVFFALCFGDEAPSRRAARRFAGCFYTMEERIREVQKENEDGELTVEEEPYTALVPLPLEMAYRNLALELGREIRSDDRANAMAVYRMIAGPMGGGSYDGSYLPGSGASIEINLEIFSDPSTKNNTDLAAYAINAWESGWGYVWGTYGQVLTESLFYSKLHQYPESVGNYADFIQANWIGRRTTDCVGLIKGYGWLNTKTMTIDYGSNGMPDLGANQMYYNASVSGTIDTMPDIPGLAVWHDGHIGVYIGNGEVIEAMGTRYGVVKTQLEGRGWTHWLQIEYINYN